MTWTHIAKWCTAITTFWLLTSVVWTWLDNRGQPWLGWALEIAAGLPLPLLLASLLAWRGRDWLQRVGWGSFLVVGAIMTQHVILEVVTR